MTNLLKRHFPLIREREEVLRDIRGKQELQIMFEGWTKERQDEFLDFCTGVRGERQNAFTYRNVKPVYTIVLFERSPVIFHDFTEDYIHHVEAKSDTGIRLELLQKYVFIPLDIFRKKVQNKGINNKLDAWLSFFCMDDPEDVVRLITAYPEFRPMYEDAYEICRNTERVMYMFSKELLELDRNTAAYMVDVMQKEIDEQKQAIDEQRQELDTAHERIAELEAMLEATK